MSLLRLLLGWAVVTIWYFILEMIEQRATGSRREGAVLRASWTVYLGDALLLTLFAALWFRSLGHGGWVLLFLLLGLLMEGPARYRYGDTGATRGTLPRVMGVLRIVVAGGLLARLM